MKNKQNKGSASIIVLLLCLVLTGIVQAFYHSVRQEADAVGEIVVQRQLQAAAADALACALTMEQKGQLSSGFCLPELELHPSHAMMRSEVAVARDDALPGRKINAAAETAAKQINLAEICLQPPLGREQNFYQNTLTAGGKISGETNDAALDSVEQAGDILAALDVASYKKWGRYSFMTKDEYQQLGFGQRIYYSSALYGEIVPSLVRELKGNAFLLAEKNINIETNLHLLGRITVVAGDNLIIGDNVRMEQALLIARHNLRIGTGCHISGIIVAGGDVTIGSSFTLQRDERVLAPFFSAAYLE